MTYEGTEGQIFKDEAESNEYDDFCEVVEDQGTKKKNIVVVKRGNMYSIPSSAKVQILKHEGANTLRKAFKFYKLHGKIWIFIDTSISILMNEKPISIGKVGNGLSLIKTETETYISYPNSD